MAIWLGSQEESRTKEAQCSTRSHSWVPNADYDPDLIDEGKLTRALEACKPQPDPYPYKAYCHLTGQSSD
jgi:hypothetical protein